MAKKTHYHTRFEPGGFYHIYNRAIDRKPLFKRDENFRFFLSRMQKYLSPVLEIHAYCLLTNHFHLLVKIRTQFPPKLRSGEADVHLIVTQHLQRFFQSYAMAFNRQENRIGSLFQQPFKRAHITSDVYMTWLVFYIHSNAQKHAMVDDFKKWKWSSYRGFVEQKGPKRRREIIACFGSREAFFQFHNQQLQTLNFLSPTRLDWLQGKQSPL
ncbi:hypothetical protein C7T94_04490 [Pedobacter yulinensis]|uniref:Transposase IS200-like domain-containing protein n=1 Tax=Pedobacter yulinensis TaxID=2126353 RepID=A0A2T3HNN8_9SPHI|nr:hypothetical protein [Pedobacter yulinensis]PST84001.1 hypothetical protein C7T94_04490 [Pedobacter yulinensis]